MLFEKSISVQSKAYSPLLQQKIELPPHLEITIDDLLQLEKRIHQQAITKWPLLANHNGFFTADPQRFPINFFELATNHARTLHNENWSDGHSIIPLLHEDYGYTEPVPTPFPSGKEILAVKGAGFSQWLSTAKRNKAINQQGKERNYPILKKMQPSLVSHTFWGGETRDEASLQYINALVLNLLIQRHGLQQATYTPLQVLSPLEMPIFQEEKISICSINEYCNPQFIFSDPIAQRYTLPTSPEVHNLAQLVYTGELIDLRVPPVTFKLNDGHRLYSYGVLRDEKMDNIDNVKLKITNFTKKIAKIVLTAHNYNITFSEGQFSSLSSGNVSIGGIVCDLDTMHLSPLTTGPISLQTIQQHKNEDIRYALQTIILYTHLYEQTQRNTREKINYQIGYNQYPVYGFALQAVKEFIEIYPQSQIQLQHNLPTDLYELLNR